MKLIPEFEEYRSGIVKDFWEFAAGHVISRLAEQRERQLSLL